MQSPHNFWYTSGSSWSGNSEAYCSKDTRRAFLTDWLHRREQKVGGQKYPCIDARFVYK